MEEEDHLRAEGEAESWDQQVSDAVFRAFQQDTAADCPRFEGVEAGRVCTLHVDLAKKEHHHDGEGYEGAKR